MGDRKGSREVDLNARPRTALELLHAYEAMRDALPVARCPARWSRARDLAGLSDHYRAFFFDAFGVLNVGDTPIPGAVERLASLRRAGRRFMVVSNAASVPSRTLEATYKAMGFDLKPHEIVTSRQAMGLFLQNTSPRLWGVVAPPDAELDDLPCRVVHLGQSPHALDQVEGFILLSSLDQDCDAKERLAHTLRTRPRPVLVANADLAAPREDGFSVEPGFLAQWLSRRASLKPVYFGKPFSPIFELALRRLGHDVLPQHVLMVGDTLHTDVLGGGHAGLHTALVIRHGVSADLDWETAIADTGIVPNHVIDHI